MTTVVNMTEQQFKEMYQLINRDLANQLGGLIRGGSGSGSSMTGFNSAMSGASRSATNYAAVVENLIDTAKKAITGNATYNDVVKAGASALSLLGTTGEIVSDAFVGIAGAANAVIESMSKNSEYGVYFSNSTEQFIKSVSETYGSWENFEKIISQNSQSLSHLGANMDLSAMKFANLSLGMQQDPYGKMIKTTMGTAKGIEYLNDIVLLTSSSLKLLNLNEKASRTSLISSSITLAKGLDDISRLTGMSKKQMMEQMEQEAKKGEIAAMVAMMTPEEHAAYLKGYAEILAHFGKEAAYGYEEMVFSKKTIGSAQPMTETGMEGTYPLRLINGVYEKIVASIDAMAAKNYKRSEELIDIAKSSTANVMRDENQLQRLAVFAMNNAIPNLSDALYKMLPLGNRDIQQRQQMMDAIKAGIIKSEEVGNITPEELQKRIFDMQRQNQTEEGSAFRGANAITNMLKDMQQAFVENVTKLLGPLDAAVATQTKIAETIKDESQEINTSLKTLVGQRNNENQGMIIPIGKSRQGGSISAVGSFLEDFGKGTPMMLHGKEGVITASQLSDIQQNAALLGAQLSISGVSSGFMPGELSTIDFSTLDITGIVDSIQDKSSMSDKSVDILDKLNTLVDSISNKLDIISEKKPEPTKEVNLNAIQDLLQQLNNNIQQVANNTYQSIQYTRDQLRATKDLSNNYLS